MKAAKFDYHRARDLADALAVLAGNPDAKPIAGSQSLGPMLNLRLARPALLVDVSRIAALRTVVDEGPCVCIGAAVTHAAIEDGCADAVGTDFLKTVAGHIGYRAVRNRGTIGGSLAHADPAADWPAALTALDAELLLVGAAGVRTVPITGFILGAFITTMAPGELVQAVRIRKLSAGARFGYCKIARKTGEWAEASASVVIDPARGYARVVMGATNGAPVVLDELSGSLSSGSSAERAATMASAVGRALSDADLYERQVRAAAVRRAIEQACAA
jgi:carbon-monoxide dehydrogenase medium subunit